MEKRKDLAIFANGQEWVVWCGKLSTSTIGEIAKALTCPSINVHYATFISHLLTVPIVCTTILSYSDLIHVYSSQVTSMLLFTVWL